MAGLELGKLASQWRRCRIGGVTSAVVGDRTAITRAGAGRGAGTPPFGDAERDDERHDCGDGSFHDSGCVRSGARARRIYCGGRGHTTTAGRGAGEAQAAAVGNGDRGRAATRTDLGSGPVPPWKAAQGPTIRSDPQWPSTPTGDSESPSGDVRSCGRSPAPRADRSARETFTVGEVPSLIGRAPNVMWGTGVRVFRGSTTRAGSSHGGRTSANVAGVVGARGAWHVVQRRREPLRRPQDPDCVKRLEPVSMPRLDADGVVPQRLASDGSPVVSTCQTTAQAAGIWC